MKKCKLRNFKKKFLKNPRKISQKNFAVYFGCQKIFFKDDFRILKKTSFLRYFYDFGLLRLFIFAWLFCGFATHLQTSNVLQQTSKHNSSVVICVYLALFQQGYINIYIFAF